MACMDLNAGNNFRSEQAMDLRMNVQKQDNAKTSNHKQGNEEHKGISLVLGKQKRHTVNVFKKHKLKYRYLWKKHKSASDSGNFGSSSMVGSSSTTGSIEKKSANESNPSPGCSSSPSSANSSSPQNFAHLDIQSDQQMCMMLGHAVPLIVMMQGQLQSTTNHNSNMSYSNTMLYKCNMCNMFSNNLADVLNHVNSNHPTIHYCFVCNQFHNSKREYERHKDVCATTQQAFQQIVGNHYQGNRKSDSNAQDQALNLTVAGGVAKRAAQIMHNKKGKQRKKIKKLQKCTYCKKAFFGRFCLQRHLRSHTGEKLCHCHICGKGFAECRNLRNHMSRFHNGSESISSSSGRSKSVSPNNISNGYKTTTFPSNHGSSEISRQNTEGVFAAAPSTSLLDSKMSKQIGTIQTCQTWSTQSDVYNKNNLAPNPYNSGSSNSEEKEANQRSYDESWCTRSDEHSANGNSEQYSYEPSTSASVDQSPSSRQNQHLNEKNTRQPVNGCGQERPSEEVKVAPTYLGSTSSRLELNDGQQGYENSLNPIGDGQGGKLFRCHICDKTFRTKFAMQRHLDFHADKRPFQCDQCSYKAKTRPQLKVHVMRHSGQKGFNCTTCNYSCVTHSDLNRHCKSRSHLFRASLLEQRPESQAASTCNSTSFTGNSTIFTQEEERNVTDLKHQISIEKLDD